MASNKESKSTRSRSVKESNGSKTAHVMNLLSKNRAPVESANITVGDVPVSTPVPAAQTTQTPAILSSIEANAAASSQIRDALESALASAEEAAPPSPEIHQPEPVIPPPAAIQPPAQPVVLEGPPVPAEQPPVQEETPAQAEQPPVQEETPAQAEQPPVQEETPVQAEQPPVQEETPAQAEQPPVQEEAPVQAAPVEVDPPAPVVQEQAEPEISYVNVMQILVEEKADKYIKLFGLCQCDRCRVDVKALALNDLPNKYVVMSKGEFVPRITFYEGRFSSAITAQILHACKIVMESPRHDLP